ncbi:MAG: hypothetical protein JSV80_04995 [Acidobacteriota bacterium]|nr:MAG: hypothetical protein JSV80_04995 [Acidobacteriota bacterium]
MMAIVVMLAAIALGYGPSASCGEDDAEELQRVAAQVAVALSNARLVDRLEQIGRETLQALARTAAIFWPSAATLMSRDTTLEDRDEESMQFLVLHKRI